MRVAAIQGSSLIDFPGRLAAIVYTQGCPYDCFYCHNRSLIAVHPHGGQVDLKKFLKSRVGLLDGVVITGGEPTIHKGLAENLSMIRELGFATKLDTNGCNPKHVHALLQTDLVDYLALDVKAVPSEYQTVCGQAARWSAVEKTLKLLRDSSIQWEVRTTVYPGMQGEDLQTIAALIGEAPLWRLNAFRYPTEYKSEDRDRLEQRVLTEEALKRWMENHRALIRARRVTT
ncbi:MAG: anaerobic ribonucleoside-triphosphate reductase activating protein [Sphaerochaeta sp.]|jgi:pyruvate formate lyase activating enzyme